jgi:hypothetical protein
MARIKSIQLALTFGSVLFCPIVWAQIGPASGLYEITSGAYSECCGIAGNDFGFDLPDPSQKFVRFTVDRQANTASMSFLGEDAKTVFSTEPCPPLGGIKFNFFYGFISSNQTIFHADPGPPPYQAYFSYIVSNSATRLRITGTLGTSQANCSDLPTRFSHSNVEAILIPGPKLTILEATGTKATRLMVQGRAGWIDVIEASGDLISWTPVATNVMDFSLCPICPFVTFEDAASTSMPHRFYRAYEFP